MRLHRFFTDEDISGETIFLSEKGLVHQIADVLRLSAGDEIVLCKDGYDARVRITEVSKNGIGGEILSLQKNTAEPDRHVTLYFSILKKENVELVVQKAVEAGVSEIVPLKTKRTVKTGLSVERLEKIAREATEQCGRARIPAVREPVEFSSVFSIVLSDSPTGGENPNAVLSFRPTEGSGGICLDIHHTKIPRIHPPYGGFPLGMTVNLFYDASGESARDFFQNQNQNKKESARVNIFIGPEGGWGADEVEVARTAGCHILSLGPRTLRAETAAIIGTFLAAW